MDLNELRQIACLADDHERVSMLMATLLYDELFNAPDSTPEVVDLALNSITQAWEKGELDIFDDRLRVMKLAYRTDDHCETLYSLPMGVFGMCEQYGHTFYIHGSDPVFIRILKAHHSVDIRGISQIETFEPSYTDYEDALINRFILSDTPNLKHLILSGSAEAREWRIHSDWREAFLKKSLLSLDLGIYEMNQSGFEVLIYEATRFLREEFKDSALQNSLAHLYLYDIPTSLTQDIMERDTPLSNLTIEAKQGMTPKPIQQLYESFVEKGLIEAVCFT